MAHPKLCFPNWTLPTQLITPMVAAPGWIDVEKLHGEVLSEMARYPAVDLAGSRLVIDLGTLRNVEVLALPYQNAGIYDSARVRLCTDAQLTNAVIDSGWQEFFGEIYPYGTLEPSRVEWVDGRLTAEDAAGVVNPWVYVADGAKIGRYLEISLDFRHNVDGYIDLGQVIASPALSSYKNISYGVTPPFYVDPSTKTRARGGPRFVDEQKKYRETKMTYNWLRNDELYAGFYEFVRRYGVVQPFFFIYDSDADPAVRQKQSFMCSIDQMEQPVNTSFNVNSLTITLAEEF